VQNPPAYDDEVLKDAKLPTVSSRPVSSVVQDVWNIGFVARQPVSALRIEGYVIVSAWLLANAESRDAGGVEVQGDKRFSPPPSTMPT